MSRENLEFVEGFFAGVGAMDRDALLAALPDLISQICDPDVEWMEDPQRADGRVHRGHQGVQESFERWLDGFDEYGFEVERCEDLGDDVLVVANEHARGAASGAEISARNYAVLTMRDGKLLRYREFSDESSARQAARSSG
jgi:ketosteroid isomerase-like protein